MHPVDMHFRSLRRSRVRGLSYEALEWHHRAARRRTIYPGKQTEILGFRLVITERRGTSGARQSGRS